MSSITRRRSAVCASSSSSASATRRLRRALELLAQAQHRGALLVGGGDELLGLALDPRLGLGDHCPLPLLELPELRLEVLLRALEVGRPGAQPLLDASLRGGEQVGELVAGGPLPRRELLPPLLGDASLLLGEQRHRVRACARASDRCSSSACAAVSRLDHGGDRPARPVEHVRRRRAGGGGRLRAAGRRPR